jgi:putative transposase
MAERRIIDDGLYLHFNTFSVYRGRKLLDHDQPKRILLGVLNEEQKVRQAKCVGFVVMPEHVHAIIWFPVVGQLSGFMNAWKRKTSFSHT